WHSQPRQRAVLLHNCIGARLDATVANSTYGSVREDNESVELKIHLIPQDNEIRCSMDRYTVVIVALRMPGFETHGPLLLGRFPEVRCNAFGHAHASLARTRVGPGAGIRSCTSFLPDAIPKSDCSLMKLGYL